MALNPTNILEYVCAEILDQTRLRVLEVRNALESCGASDFSYQYDAVFFKDLPQSRMK